MSKKKRFLITTEDENTWKFDCPVIFLGEWCRRYDRENIWKKLDFIDAKPYGIELAQQDIDLNEVLNLEKKLFPEICDLLNEYHSIRLSSKSWKIFVGWVFRMLIVQLFNKIQTLKYCLDNYEISGTISYRYNKFSITPNFFSEIQEDRIFAPWKNNILDNKILNLLDNNNFPIKYIENNNLKKKLEINKNSKIENNYKQKIFFKLCKFYNNISKRFIRSNDAFIMNTYLPSIEEFKLELSLGQFPQLWKFNKDNIEFYDNLQNIKIDEKNRDKLTKNFESNSDNNLENIIRKLLFELWPTIYLEGFNELSKVVNNQPWPKSPKFIFTSNEYYNNEIFKLWTALKVEKGAKYFVGQHGNDHVITKNNTPTQQSSDKFITWGYSNQTKKFFPAFKFIKKKFRYNKKGGLLLIENTHIKNFSTFDKKFQFIKYLKNQLVFVSLLKNEPRKKITIRLNPEIHIKRWSIRRRWLDFDPNLNLDNETKITKLISENRLIVHSYDSTGILETMSQNIPTLAFWLYDYDHLVDDAKPYYKLLFDAGIIHFTAESASKQINLIWNNIDSWWNKREVQEARRLFCDRYAKLSNNRISKLKSILLL